MAIHIVCVALVYKTKRQSQQRDAYNNSFIREKITEKNDLFKMQE